MRLGQHAFQALRQRRLPRQLPPAAESFQKLLDFLQRLIPHFAFRILSSIECRPKMHALRSQPNLRQFVEGQAGERRTEHGDGRHVLQWIVQQLQQAQQIHDFIAVVKSTALDNERHARALKFLRINFRLARRRTQQHRHVAPPGGAKALFFRIPNFVFSGFKLLQSQREQPRLLFRLLQIRQIVIAGFSVGFRVVAALFETQQ